MYTIAVTGAVIYTDTVQTLILITGAVALTVIGLDKVGASRICAHGARWLFPHD